MAVKTKNNSKRKRGDASERTSAAKSAKYTEKTLEPVIAFAIMAVVAVVSFIIEYARLSGTWTDGGTLVWLVVACALGAVVSTVLLEAYLFFEARETLVNPKKLLVIATLMMLSTLLTAATTLVSYAFVAAFLAIILTGLLVSRRMAYPMTLVMAVMCGIMAMTGVGVGCWDKPAAAAIAVLAGGTVSVLMLGMNKGRTLPLISGASGGLAAALSMLLMSGLSGVGVRLMFIDAAWMLGGGVLCGILATGLLPLFENVFDIATDARLNELMNNNNPLLKRLMLEAPGTYHHSLIVAALSEAAAELVGANTLLCKAAAYYHDVGKLTSPRYFKENQGEYNIHDDLTPWESARRIIAHQQDGAALLIKNKFPSEIVKMAGQHHGDSLVSYFYSKAIELAADPSSVNIEDYRYHAEKPKSKELAILMLADCCEAAVRAIRRPTAELIEERVKYIIAGLWSSENGQLTESPLTARDIRLIENCFINTLKAQYHERIEYPQMQQARAQTEQTSAEMQAAYANRDSQGFMTDERQSGAYARETTNNGGRN